MTSTAPLAIGIDVGGTKIAGGLVDLSSGGIGARRSIATRPERGGEAVLADALELARELRATGEAQGRGVEAIGVAVCELVDREQRVTSGHAVAWQGLAVRERFAEIAPAAVEADVRAHALAEASYGAGRPYRLFVFVTIGTGISSCLVQDGRPFAGARGNALVLASSPLTAVCGACGAVNRPVLEEEAAGPALVARYNRAAGARARSGEEVFAAVAAGDAAAIDVVRSAAAAVGVSVGWLVNVLDPEAVVIGGGLGTAGGLYWEALVASAREHIWAEAGRGLPIVPAALGPDAGVIGAARYAASA